jgi:hypothetical protein
MPDDVGLPVSFVFFSLLYTSYVLLAVLIIGFMVSFLHVFPTVLIGMWACLEK